MIKKITSSKIVSFLLGAGLLFGSSAFAKQVPVSDAKTVAENFFHQYSSASTSQLIYTSIDDQGQTLYYVFNMNSNNGFVIVSAEDATHPIIGYSTERGFQKPDSKTTIAFWLSKREKEISNLKQNYAVPNAAITAKWNRYLTSGPQPSNRTASGTTTVSPLLLSNWNQSPFYNDSCPGNSVTGCVATTMAQIMKYWSYPTQGVGSTSYCDCSNSGFSNTYGTLSADFSSTTYNWSNMPLTLNGHNDDIAVLMYQCGVSVNMNYDPSGSSAAVISSDSPISAQNAYVNYFQYDPNTILGVHRLSYSDSAWISLLKADLDLGRPVQYAGFGSEGGHTWVCDGYDNNNFFHMNWGWGGAANGYFNIDDLSPMGDDFSNFQEGLFGIVPMASDGLDAGIVSVSQLPSGCGNALYTPTVKIRNFGYDDLISCSVEIKLDNVTVQTSQWSGDLITGQSADLIIPTVTLTNGAHVLSCVIANPNNGIDVNTVNNQSNYSFAIFSGGTLPVSEGFEIPAQTTEHWSPLTSQTGVDWSFTSQASAGGSQAMMVNNLSNTPGAISILQGLNNYDFSIIAHPYFNFKIAYQQKTISDKDKLSLQISNDCGVTWWTKWSKQGSALATTTVLSNSAFIPAQNDFSAYSIPGVISRNTIFRWVFTADALSPGNNIYLDDINLGEGATVGIKEISATESSFDVFPNPGNSETFLKFKLDNASDLEIKVIDISSREVIEIPKTNYSAGDQLISINKEGALSRGIYMVTLSSNGVKSSRKLIIN